MVSKFNSCVHYFFDGLAHKQGLVTDKSEPSVVSYANRNLALAISYDDTRSYALSFRFERELPNKSRESFFLEEYLGMVGDSNVCWVSNAMVGKEEGMSAVIERLANIVDRHSSDLFESSLATFADVLQFRKRQGELLTDDFELNSARLSSEEAWRNKDYRRFVSILEGKENLLTDVEREKLRFARAKIELQQ